MSFKKVNVSSWWQVIHLQIWSGSLRGCRGRTRCTAEGEVHWMGSTIPALNSLWIIKSTFYDHSGTLFVSELVWWLFELHVKSRVSDHFFNVTDNSQTVWDNLKCLFWKTWFKRRDSLNPTYMSSDNTEADSKAASLQTVSAPHSPKLERSFIWT